MKSSSKVVLLVLMMFILAGCQSNNNNNQSENAANNEKDFVTSPESPDDLILRNQMNIDEKAAFLNDMNWTLSSVNEKVFYKPLLVFMFVNNRYPYDIDEFISSKIPLVWPANPETGNPFEIVDNVEPTKDYFGKISYIRKSDTNAWFETVIFDKEKDEYVLLQLPSAAQAEKTLNDLKENNKPTDLVLENYFRTKLSCVIDMALSKAEYRLGIATPGNLGEAVHGNFFLIEDNLSADFFSADPSESLFFEKGFALLDDEFVQFEEFTVRKLSPNGNEYLHHSFGIESIRNPQNWWPNDQGKWDSLTNKHVFFSTKQILDGSLHIPKSALISKKDIPGLK
ncbi:hypothetical protein J7L05_12410 [bacterium]|nr:hypothetical protein [bacterium]